MPTDLQKLRALLTEFGVEFTEKEDPHDGRVTITCEEGSKGVRGYSCFYTLFEFDASHKFLEIGAYE